MYYITYQRHTPSGKVITVKRRVNGEKPVEGAKKPAAKKPAPKKPVVPEVVLRDRAKRKFKAEKAAKAAARKKSGSSSRRRRRRRSGGGRGRGRSAAGRRSSAQSAARRAARSKAVLARRQMRLKKQREAKLRREAAIKKRAFATINSYVHSGKTLRMSQSELKKTLRRAHAQNMRTTNVRGETRIEIQGVGTLTVGLK